MGRALLTPSVPFPFCVSVTFSIRVFIGVIFAFNFANLCHAAPDIPTSRATVSAVIIPLYFIAHNLDVLVDLWSDPVDASLRKRYMCTLRR